MSWARREDRAGCSKRPSSKAAASEEARRTLRYVEPLSDARTPLAAFFSILLDDFPEVFDRAKEGILELYLRLPFQESTRLGDIGPSDFGIIGGQRMMGDLAR
jgi:hypothetical protein